MMPLYQDGVMNYLYILSRLSPTETGNGKYSTSCISGITCDFFIRIYLVKHSYVMHAHVTFHLTFLIKKVNNTYSAGSTTQNVSWPPK